MSLVVVERVLHGFVAVALGKKGDFKKLRKSKYIIQFSLVKEEIASMMKGMLIIVTQTRLFSPLTSDGAELWKVEH